MGRLISLAAAAGIALAPVAAKAHNSIPRLTLPRAPLASPLTGASPLPAAALADRALFAPSALPLQPSAVSAAVTELTGRADENAAAAQTRLDALWDGATGRAPSNEALSALDALVEGRASPEFVARARSHIARVVPAPIMRELARGGYRIHIDERIRQGRARLSKDHDYTGGFHSYGPKGKFIVIAEKIKHAESGEWLENLVWENAIDHELGHAVAYLLGERAGAAAGATDQALWYRTKGMSESPEFRDAWRRDFDEIPAALKNAPDPASTGDFSYYLRPDANGWFQRARQETWAEGFDILLRSERSSYNFENFRRWFPRAQAVLRRILETEYGHVFPLPGRTAEVRRLSRAINLS